MRIGVVTTSYPEHEGDPSGHFVRAEVRALERAGHDVVVFAPRGGAFGWPGVATRIRERPSRALSAAFAVARLAARIARAPALDRIIAHWAVPSAFPLSLAAPCPLTVVSHGGDVRALLALPRAAREAIVRSIVARAETWRFVSKALERSLAHALAPPTARAVAAIATIAASPIDLPAAVERVDRASGRRLAVTVGRLVPTKRVDRIITTIARENANTRLVIVGDGPERSRLERLARAHGVDAVFTGLVHRDEALSWIASADVLLHASEAEGASTVIREAEALGTPVLIL